MMDILADRAGFTWRDSYGTYGNPPEGKDWSDVVIWLANSYDVVVDYFYRTTERLELGAVFLPGWYDATLIMIAEDEIKRKTDFFAWLRPFDYRTWIMTILVSIFTSVIYWGMCRLSRDQECRFNNLTQYYYLTALAITGHFEFKPNTLRTMILTLSIAFWSVLLIAAYTANLASFFIVENASTLNINSIHDAVYQNRNICVWKGTPDDSFITSEYPTYQQFIRFEDDKELFLSSAGLSKQCDVTVTSVGTWNTYEDQKAVNKGCKLKEIGRVLKFREGSYVMKSDSGNKCTNFIRDVLTVHIEEMLADGTIVKLRNDFYKSIKNQDCSAKLITRDGDEETQVTLKGMGGAFFIMLALTTLAVTISIVLNIRKHTKNSTTARIHKNTLQDSTKTDNQKSHNRFHRYLYDNKCYKDLVAANTVVSNSIQSSAI